MSVGRMAGLDGPGRGGARPRWLGGPGQGPARPASATAWGWPEQGAAGRAPGRPGQTRGPGPWVSRRDSRPPGLVRPWTACRGTAGSPRPG